MTNFMSKIKNFNQILLAICSMLGILLLLFFLIMIRQDMLPRHGDVQNDGILAIEEVEELNRDSIRKQIISFNSITVIDSANQIFLLPVSQATLNIGERYDDISLKDMSYRKSRRMGYNYNYNNLALYFGQKKASELIFDQRTSISDYNVHVIDGKKYIVINAAMADTNKDGFLNNHDVQHLFVYDLEQSELYEIAKKDSYTVLDIVSPSKSNALIVQFGVDRNHDKVFDIQTEPQLYYILDVNTMTVREMVQSNHIDALQKQLEGR